MNRRTSSDARDVPAVAPPPAKSPARANAFCNDCDVDGESSAFTGSDRRWNTRATYAVATLFAAAIAFYAVIIFMTPKTPSKWD